MASLLAKRLITGGQVQLENEDITGMLNDVEQDIGEKSAVVAAGLQEINMLSDAVDMLDAIDGSAEGLIKSNVEPAVVATALAPALVNVLDTIDSEVAMQASVDLESDSEEAKSDKGEGFFKRIKDYAIKIWEAIKKSIARAVEWLKGLFDRFFDGATVLNRKAKQLLNKIGDSDVWNSVKLKGKGEWSVDLKDPTESTLLQCLDKHSKIIQDFSGFAQTEIAESPKRLDETLALIKEHTATNQSGRDRYQLQLKLNRLSSSAGDVAKDVSESAIHKFSPVGVTIKEGKKIKVTDSTDGYTASDIDSFSKRGCIKILEKIILITDECMKMKKLYAKASDQLKKLEAKVEHAFFLYSKNIEEVSYEPFEASKHNVQWAVDALFKNVKTRLNNTYYVWRELPKTISLLSLGNAFNLMQQHYSRCTKAE